MVDVEKFEVRQRPALPVLETLFLNDNEIGDAGLTSFSGALARGALPNLVKLFLDNNQIGDEGMKSLSEALDSGALANLQVCTQNLAKFGSGSFDCAPYCAEPSTLGQPNWRRWHEVVLRGPIQRGAARPHPPRS